MESTGLRPPPFRLGLGELMLGIAAIAAGLAEEPMVSLLGVIAGLFLVPTLARTRRILQRRAALGRPVDGEAWLLAAGESLGRVMLAYFLTSLALLASSWAVAIVLAVLFGVLHRTNLLTERIGLAGLAAGGTFVVIATGATFLLWARRDWPVRDHELGRAPGPAANPPESPIERVSESSGER